MAEFEQGPDPQPVRQCPGHDVAIAGPCGILGVRWVGTTQHDFTRTAYSRLPHPSFSSPTECLLLAHARHPTFDKVPRLM